jgi:hypothetical protein
MPSSVIELRLYVRRRFALRRLAVDRGKRWFRSETASFSGLSTPPAVARIRALSARVIAVRYSCSEILVIW